MTQQSSNNQNQPLKVGFEIEFIGITIQKTAELVAELFDGQITNIHQDAVKVETPIGTFRVEVDAQLLDKLSSESSKNIKSNRLDLEGLARNALAPLLQTFVPNEVVCPPIPRTEIGELEPLVNALRKAGARGTSAALSYAFGLHINSEVDSLEPDILLAKIKAFVLLYDWLRKDMHIDATRMITMFAKGYPKIYCCHILRSNYQPSLDDLIQDYLTYVPSRNFALDCYPLFMHLDPHRVKTHLQDPLIKPRPAFHFRMPNCSIDNPEWTLYSQWRYWLLIENLSVKHELMADMALDYLAHKEGWLDVFSKKWEKKLLNDYLSQL